MSEAASTGEAISGAAWLEGLGERQKILARLCPLKADDAQLLEALARIMACYGPLEKPWCFLAIEALLPPSVFWRAFHQYWQSFEQPPHGRYLWTLGRRRIHWRAEYMAPDDAAAFAALPETLRLYRDQDNRSRVALSWRLCEAAGGGRHENVSSIKAKAPKAKVAGLYATRAETQIVLFSCRHAAAL
jgi:hypothetical protein